MTYRNIIDDLRKRSPSARNVALKDVKVDEKDLIGTFHIRGEDTLLEHRKLKYRFISRREIDDVEKTEKGAALSKLDVKERPEFYLDEYGAVYLQTPSTFTRLSSKDMERKDVISRAKNWISFNCGPSRENISIKSIFHQEGLFTILLDEKGSERDHYLVVEKEEGVKEYKRVDSQDPLKEEKELEGLTKLPFTHGIELEVQVVKENWRWMDGDQMAIVFEEILSGARKKISELRREADKVIQAKWTEDVVIKEDDKGYDAVHVAYGSERKFYSVLGKDSHVALKTNILELQTPPCEYLEELEWWIYNLYRISHEVVEQLDIGATVLSVGTNPVEEYSKGVTFGEHHHLGIEEKELRNRVHNTFRYLTPHLISISANTPFLGNREPRVSFNEGDNLVILEPSYSMRLKKNKEQFRVPPYLPDEVGKEYLEQELGMTQKSLRMIDIYPFTRFDTLEVRMFDTQITTMDRISIALLLQALALYASEELDENPGQIISDDVLEKNRQISIEDGLMGILSLTSEEDHPLLEAFSERYIHESWKSILQKLWPYIEAMNAADSIYMRNLFLRLHKLEDISHSIPLKPPRAPSQVLLCRGYSSGEEEDFKDLLHELKYLSTKAATDKRYNLWAEYVDLEEIELTDLQGLSPGSIQE